MNDHPEFMIPEKTAGDHGHLAARAGISAVPFVGGPLLEIFNALVTPPIEKRRTQWVESVAAAIQKLEKNEHNLVERLQQDETFQSVLLQASWAAVRNHQIEKLTALKTAVENAAVASNEAQLLFIRFVDELTPTHLVVMNFFVKHEEEVAHQESYQKLIETFSAICNQEIEPFFFKFICEDLKARGLVRISENIHDLPGVYGESMLLIEEPSKDPKIIVSNLGHSFLAFVLTSPLEGEP